LTSPVAPPCSQATPASIRALNYLPKSFNLGFPQIHPKHRKNQVHRGQLVLVKLCLIQTLFKSSHSSVMLAKPSI
jgi:hypothetical protein